MGLGYFLDSIPPALSVALVCLIMVIFVAVIAYLYRP